jgi:hypothetical protein
MTPTRLVRVFAFAVGFGWAAGAWFGPWAAGAAMIVGAAIAWPGP